MEVIHKIGRRKKSVARVYLSKGKGTYTINGKSLKEYFPWHAEMRNAKIIAPNNTLLLKKSTIPRE